MLNDQKEKGHHIEICDNSFTVIHEGYFEDDEFKNSKKSSFLLKGLNLDNILNKVESQNSHSHTPEENYRASLFVAFSSFLYSITNFLGKVLGFYYPKVENSSTNFIRGIVIIILSHIYFNKHKINLLEQLNRPKKKLIILILRVSSGALCNFLLFESLKYMRISSSFTIFNLAPIFTTILTIIFMNGKLLNIDIIAFIFCFFSVTLITKPAFLFTSYSYSEEEDQPIGIAMSIIAAALSGLAVFWAKLIIKDFHISFNVYCMGISFAIISLIVTPFTKHGFSSITFIPFLIAIILSLFFYFSLFAFIYALSIGDPIKILPITYLGIVLTMIYNYFIFGQSCDYLDIIGSFLIILINVYKTLYH